MNSADGGGLEPVIHAPKRLRIMAILSSSTDVDFRFLVDQLSLSESDLSKQMKALAEAGFVKVNKTGVGRGSETRYSVTRAGRKAFKSHVQALQSIIDGADEPVADGPASKA